MDYAVVKTCDETVFLNAERLLQKLYDDPQYFPTQRGALFFLGKPLPSVSKTPHNCGM